MRIHTNLPEHELYHAATHAQVSITDYERHGSRKRDHAFDVWLSGSGAHRSQYRAQNVPAATWDEWGIFLATIFQQDPTAIATYYKDAEDFHYQTGGRFRTLQPSEQHRKHRWTFLGEVLTGGVYVSECQCGAVRRWRR